MWRPLNGVLLPKTCVVLTALSESTFITLGVYCLTHVHSVTMLLQNLTFNVITLELLPKLAHFNTTYPPKPLPLPHTEQHI